MLIDWFTVGAQVVNFLILLLLLRRFLYRPILNAMERRERLIQEQLQEAEQKRQQAEQEFQRYQEQNQALRQKKLEIQHQAEEEVQAWRKEALHRARQEVEATLKEWRQSVADQQEAFAAEMRQFVIHQTYAIADQALRDLADATLEERAVEKFLAHLKRQEGDLSAFKQNWHRSGAGELTLRSAFELSPALRQKAEQELGAQFGENLRLRYETAPDLGVGVELVGADGYRLAWNLRRYLEALQEELEAQLQQVIGLQAAAASHAEA